MGDEGKSGLSTRPQNWKKGQSGNPKGNVPKRRALTEMLRLKGEERVMVGGEEMTAKEILTQAVWQFVMAGEVWLLGKHLEASSIREWTDVVKWLYVYVEPPRMRDEPDPEIVVRVVRDGAGGGNDGTGN